MTIDPDDEFEKDLNTIPDEDDDFQESNIASEMSSDWLEHCQNQASNESNDKSSNTQSSSIAAQMCDIFEFLSPDLPADPATSDDPIKDADSDAMNSHFQSDRLNSRFGTVLNEEISCNGAIEHTDTSVKNIAGSLQKSLINE